ncbi:hypothetical protein BY996DRAFT_6424219 [Phakopsora pachyrhizi]|nr:hypothetical protein BY996DRAFT_6424219 [Phakopsora pachyrhizi]
MVRLMDCRRTGLDDDYQLISRSDSNPIPIPTQTTTTTTTLNLQSVISSSSSVASSNQSSSSQPPPYSTPNRTNSSIRCTTQNLGNNCLRSDPDAIDRFELCKILDHLIYLSTQLLASSTSALSSTVSSRTLVNSSLRKLEGTIDRSIRTREKQLRTKNHQIESRSIQIETVQRQWPWDWSTASEKLPDSQIRFDEHLELTRTIVAAERRSVSDLNPTTETVDLLQSHHQPDHPRLSHDDASLTSRLNSTKRQSRSSFEEHRLEISPTTNLFHLSPPTKLSKINPSLSSPIFIQPSYNSSNTTTPFLPISSISTLSFQHQIPSNHLSSPRPTRPKIIINSQLSALTPTTTTNTTDSDSFSNGSLSPSPSLSYPFSTASKLLLSFNNQNSNNHSIRQSFLSILNSVTSQQQSDSSNGYHHRQSLKDQSELATSVLTVHRTSSMPNLLTKSDGVTTNSLQSCSSSSNCSTLRLNKASKKTSVDDTQEARRSSRRINLPFIKLLRAEVDTEQLSDSNKPISRSTLRPFRKRHQASKNTSDDDFDCENGNRFYVRSFGKREVAKSKSREELLL